MADVKRFSLVKPTIQTRFHIDYEWWIQNDRDWRVYLRGYLCPEHQESFANVDSDEMVDWIDPETAEITRVDGLQHVLISHCANMSGFITERTALVDAVFRTFMAIGNTPLTPIELADKLGRPPGTILKLLSGGIRVYRGMRPCPEY